MGILEKIVAKIAPHDCLGCGVEGSLLCSACLALLPPVPERCYRCHSSSPGFITCSRCTPTSLLYSVQAATIYKGLAKDLIWKIKSAGALAAAEIMARRMLPLLSIGDRTILVAVPTATSRVRQRGYDQTRLIVRQLAIQAQLPWVDCLARSGQAHQVGANRQQRLQQLRDALRVNRHRLVHGAHIILIDDVVTTGATLEAAAKVLIEAGAVRVEAITFAQTTNRK